MIPLVMKSRLYMRRKGKYYIQLYSNYIVNYSFYLYFFIYMIGRLNHKSEIYNYILILLFGIFLGYKFSTYSKDKIFNK